MCTSCGGSGAKAAKASYTRAKAVKATDNLVVVGKSANPTVKVPVQYFGGGMVKKTTGATCSSCGGAGNMALLTSETIMFASDDAPYGMFKQFVQAGRTYYVTEKQAEYLLTLTYTNNAGQTVNKFKRLEQPS